MTSHVDLSIRDQQCLWHPYTQMLNQPPPLAVVRGEGVYLYTDDGKRILDGISSWWVNIHGHSHPKINAALSAQAEQIEHVLFAGCTHPPAVELAERLVEVLPQGLSRVFYSDNGSTAVEVALKMAWQYWQNRDQEQRTDFICFDDAYHGDTVGAMSVSEASSFTDPFRSLLFPVSRVDGLETLERYFKEHSSTVAAVIVEPMLQGVAGMIMRPPEFLSELRKLCDRYDTLLIADEVLTGFGRTGRMFACEHANISPDIICLSKGLTAGYLPMGATVATESVYASFLSEDRKKTFFHGHSYCANPLACAVGLASLDIFRDDGVIERIAHLEAQLVSGLSVLRDLPNVGDVRVLGGVGVVEFKSNSSSPAGDGYFDQIGPRLAKIFLERGLLIRPLGNVLYFMPPYVISDKQTSWALENIQAVVRETASR